MKHKIFMLFFLSALVALNVSCSKPELAQPHPDNVIKLQIRGSSEVDLEYVYKDSVIATSLITSGKNILIDTRLLIKEEGATFQIRKKGSSEILQTKQLSPSPFIQNFTVFYDGITVYDNAVTLIIKGYALSGELEFLVADKVVLAGTGAIDNNDKRTVIFMNKGTTREIQVRKKGETEVLLTKTINAAPSIQNLNFFFDGKKIVDNVQLDPPANPANMMVKAKFETQWPANFKGVDVELVLYTKDPRTNAAAVKTSPEIRFTLFKDGTFNSIELPPLPPNYIYSYDIVEKGTNQIPYVNVAPPVIQNGFPLTPNLGRFGVLMFEAGKSKLLVLRDNKYLIATPRGTALSGGFTDLSQYFQ